MIDLLLSLLSSDAVRYAVAVEMLLLLAAAVWLHTIHGAGLPRPLLLMGYGLLSVVAVLAAGVVLNALVGPAPTPAVYLVAVGALPATLGGLVLVCRDLRATRHA